MELKKESNLAGYPTFISYESTQKILEQMEKNICKIKIGQNQGTGFFCKIPFPDKNNMLPVFISIDQINLINKNFGLKRLQKEKNNINSNFMRRLNKFDKKKETELQINIEAASLIQAVWKGYSIRKIMKLYNHLDEFTYHLANAIFVHLSGNFYFFYESIII